MKWKPYLPGAGGVVGGLALLLIRELVRVSILEHIGSFVILAGLICLAIARYKVTGIWGLLFTGGIACLVVSVLYGEYVLILEQFEIYRTTILMDIGIPIGSLLLILGLILTKREIDIRALKNIRHNGNTWLVILYSVLLLIGGFGIWYGEKEWDSVIKLGGCAVLLYSIGWILWYMAESDAWKHANHSAQDTEFSGKIQWMQKSLRLQKYILALCVIAMATVFYRGSSEGSYILGFILCIPTVLTLGAMGACRRIMKEYVSGNITKQALDEVFDITEYNPFGHMEAEQIADCDFGLEAYAGVNGSDHIKGFYKGLPIEMCDMILTKKEVATREDEYKEVRKSIVFQGLWLICDFGKPLSAQLRLWEREGLDKMTAQKGIMTENESFYKRFHVESEIEEEAFYILTPHMMEYILAMDEKAEGRTHMCFERGGKVHIAIHSGRDAFEVAAKEQDAASLRQKFMEEIRYITDLIDELRLVDTLYASEIR